MRPVLERHRVLDIPDELFLRRRELRFRVGGLDPPAVDLAHEVGVRVVQAEILHSAQEVADAIHVEIERLKKDDISDEELKMIKTRAKANLIRGLAENEGLANQLATYQTRYGDWRELFRSVDRIDKVTKADVRRVANETFTDTNRTVGVIENVPGGGEAAEQAPAERSSSDEASPDESSPEHGGAR